MNSTILLFEVFRQSRYMAFIHIVLIIQFVIYREGVKTSTVETAGWGGLTVSAPPT